MTKHSPYWQKPGHHHAGGGDAMSRDAAARFLRYARATGGTVLRRRNHGRWVYELTNSGQNYVGRIAMAKPSTTTQGA